MEGADCGKKKEGSKMGLSTGQRTGVVGGRLAGRAGKGGGRAPLWAGFLGAVAMEAGGEEELEKGTGC